MITAITIENFKGIGEPVRLELRPITLLFGMNSAGKSSILHALIYAREVFERHNLDADRTLSAGESLDLGGFMAFVHNHDPKKPIRLRFDLNLADVDLPGHWNPDDDDDFKDGEFMLLHMQLKTAWVGLTIAWSEAAGQPYVAEYETGINGIRFGRIVADGPRANIRALDIEEDHPVFRLENLQSEIAGQVERSETGSEAGPAYLQQILEKARQSLVPAGEAGAIGLPHERDALPDLARLEHWSVLGVAADLEQADALEMDSWTFYKYRPALQKLERILYHVLVGPALLLRDLLRQFRYIGPLRQVPPRDYAPPRHEDPARWARGLAAWDLLYLEPELVKRVSQVLSDPNQFNLEYTLDEVNYYQVDWSNPLAYRAHQGRLDELEDPAQWLTKAPIRRRLVFRPLASPEVYLEPADLGVGIGQVIPVLAAALDDRPLGSATLPAQLVAIEHPELNLHPRLQAELGDVFLDGVLSEATKGRVLFVETHSEHLVLRLLRRVREVNRVPPPATAGEAASLTKRRRGAGGATLSARARGGRKKTPGRPAEAENSVASFLHLTRMARHASLKPNDIGIWFVDRSEGQLGVRRIDLDSKGDFIDPWPDTLFDQDFYERFA